jgi:tRNA pseudouridine(55) synthase
VTRLVEYLSNADKYLTEIILGVQTDTDDLEGEIVRSAPVPPLTPVDLERLLDRFRGTIEQVPPAYAAVKIGGQRLYDLARAGRPIAAPARTVTIHRLMLLAWQPPAMTLLVECAKGTYIRSLARDLGAAAGCGGYVQVLRRVRTGPFCLADSLTLTTLAEQPLPATNRRWPWRPTFLGDYHGAVGRRWGGGLPPATGHWHGRAPLAWSMTRLGDHAGTAAPWRQALGATIAGQESGTGRAGPL